MVEEANKVRSFFSIRLNAAWVVVLATVLITLASYLDNLSGRNFGLSAFYLIPICWACWKAGRNVGIFMAVISSIAWLYLNGFIYKHPLIAYWNAFMLLVLYLVVVFLLSASQKAHRNLAEMIKALQAEMAERKRLEMAAIQAERLAVVGTMAAQVAHEVRNPLGSIMLNLDLLEKEYSKRDGTAISDEILALFGDIRAEIQRIKRFIEYYLKFARLPRQERHPLELNEFLDEKLSFMGGEFERAKVKVHTGFDGAVGKVNADSEQLWQATLNLIHNSMDAMPTGGELTVGTWREGGQTRIRVSDRGQGMNEDQMQRVFTPFFTTKQSGTGLGLTLVRQIAVEHGGHVECESHVGEGTTFTIFLPSMEKFRQSNQSKHFSAEDDARQRVEKGANDGQEIV